MYEIIIYGIETRITERILVGSFGTKIKKDEATQGYYLVEWLYEPYTV